MLRITKNNVMFASHRLWNLLYFYIVSITQLRKSESQDEVKHEDEAAIEHQVFVPFLYLALVIEDSLSNHSNITYPLLTIQLLLQTFNEQDKDAPEQDEDAPQQDEDSPEQGEQDLEMQEEAAHGSDPKETELLEVKTVLYCLPLHYIVHFIPAVELPISKSTCLKGIDPKVILHIQPI